MNIIRQRSMDSLGELGAYNTATSASGTCEPTGAHGATEKFPRLKNDLAPGHEPLPLPAKLK